MEHSDMVEKLYQKANISPAEARDALERAGWDMLDALMLLEKEGKINPLTASMTTMDGENAYEKVEATASKKKSSGFFDGITDLLSWIFGRLFSYNFIVKRKLDDGEIKEILKLPAFLFVLILMVMFKVSVIAMVIGLFLDCTYSVENLKKSE